MIIPSLFTNARILIIIWTLFVFTIYKYFNNIEGGEKAAIWCFLSIIFFLPTALFNKQILNIL